MTARIITDKEEAERAILAGAALVDEDGFTWDRRCSTLWFDDCHQCSGTTSFAGKAWRDQTSGPFRVEREPHGNVVSLLEARAK